MTSDETRRSTLRSNRNTIRALVLLAIVLIAIGSLTVLNWGVPLIVLMMTLVGVALVGTLWVIGMRGTRR